MTALVHIVEVAVRRSRFLTLATIAVVIVSLALLLAFKKRVYRADTVLATVSSTKNVGGVSGLAASLTGGPMMGGFVLTPDLLSDLAVSRGVLLDVALSHLASDPPQRVIDSLTRSPEAPPLHLVERGMRDIVSSSVNRKTGLITVAVQLPDSALARVILERTVQHVSDKAVGTARAQAAEQRVGLEARVDSASRVLSRAELALVEFTRANRTIAPYSFIAVERDRLSRAVNLAQSVYSQAVNEVEAARARELEETPAVVTVDEIPSELTPLPRRATLISLAFGAVFFALALGALVAGDLLGRAQANGDPDVTRLLDVFKRRGASATAHGNGNPRDGKREPAEA